MFTRARNANKGFTLTEVIVVLVVIAILAATLIPSFIAMIRHEQQKNRENIARTLYVAMQNQLTRATVEGNLHTMLTDGFYLEDNDLVQGFADANLVGKVSNCLDVFPVNDTENIDNVYFISKPSNYVFGENKIIDDFYALLDEIIVNKEILDGAILMEFNVRTGVVMSIFYGDDLSGQTVFAYGGTDGNSDIIGERGMESAYPSIAYSRRQGYYGVDYTGIAPTLPIEDIVRIYDGMNYDDGAWQLHASQGEQQFGLNVSPDATNPVREKNVLFAEYLLQQPLDVANAEQRMFYIFDTENADSEARMLLSFNDSSNIGGSTTVYTDFRTAIEQTQNNDNHAVYLDTDTRVVVNQHGVDVGGLFNRYIWILDFIEENIFTQPNNIVEKYSNIDHSMNVRAGISIENGKNIESPMYANTHFLDKWPNGTYEVTSVRHLNNIIYVPDGNYAQTADIDMRTLINEMAAEINRTPYNFRPITNLTGSYNAVNGTNLQWRIEYLRINTSDKSAYNNQNVGLFSNVQGNIVGVSLFDAEIIAPNATNVGSIAGILDGGQVIRSNSFANVLGDSGNIGGLIGRIENKGVLSYSFNAGYFNTHSDTRTFQYMKAENGENELVFIGTGSVIANGGNIGGLVGSNDGKITYCHNNARVNIEDVEIDPDTYQSISYTSTATVSSGTNLGGIAGLNESTETIENSYATNFVAIYNDANINTGGIAGTNTGTIRNSHYIANGATDSGADWGSLTREELSDIANVRLPSGFDVNIDYLAAYGDGVQKNKYTQYPYPILANNNPFAYIEESILDPLQESHEMGWEDIYGETIIHAGALVYYEFYSDYSRRYVSPYLSTTIVSAGSSALVTHDGYAIEFYPNTQGYLFEYGEGHFYKIIQIDNEWRVLVIVDGIEEAVLDEDWQAAEQFVPTINIPEDGIDNPVMYRIYIPNYLALEYASSPTNKQIDIRLFPNAETSIDEITSVENILSRVNAPGSGVVESYNPLFANFTNTTNASIRSARQMDNINFVAGDTSGVFTQHLNIDYAINYYGEVVKSSGNTFNTNTTTRRLFAKNAIITEQFAGRFVGTNMWISNLMINTPSSDNVGLFAENAGIIEQVTLRLYSYTTDTIVGRSNVGGIVGTNLSSGIVKSCFVQQVVTRNAQGQLPDWSDHPAAVRGTSNVGGIVGNNLGALNDVIFTSTSARPAIRGTNTASVGGIAGVTASEIDNIMYLAVAPRIGSGRAEMRPFTGSNTSYGNNAVYLSGEPALRPFQTVLDGGTASYTDYNLRATGQKLDYPAMDTKSIVESYSTVQFNNNWTINNTNNINFDAMQNHTQFLYPFPIGTVPSIEREEWPVVAFIPNDLPDELGLIYYEKYTGGGIGIFARYYDAAGNLRIMDYLRYDNPIITEAGYGAEIPTGFNTNANRPVVFSQYINNSWSPWAELNAGGPGGQMQLSGLDLPVPQLQPRKFVYFPARLLLSAAESAQNPIEPIILFISSSSGKVELPGIKAFVNPFFAKEVYPVDLGSGSGTPPVLSNVKNRHPTEHAIRTPWQLQNISLYIEKSVALCSNDHEHTFIQEIDIDMTKTGLGVSLVSPPGNNQPTVAQLANIVRGEFTGVYNGQGNNISNLSLVNSTTGTNITRDNKGLFNTIGVNGTIENLTLYNSYIQNGSNNGSFASINNGVVRNVAFVSGNSTTSISQQPITGSDKTGGIVGTNDGTIENALFLAQASGSSTTAIAPITAAGEGTEINAYYLSGTYSSVLRPTQAPQTANFNIFPTSAVVRGEPRTTQELNASSELGEFWRQSSVLTLNNTILSEYNPYPYLGTSPTMTWPVATVTAKDIVYFEEYSDGTVGFYSTQSSSGLPELSNNNDVQVTRYGYAVMIDRPGTFGISINASNGNNTYINSIDTARPGVGVETSYYYAVIPTTVASGVSGEIYVNDQATGYWIDTRFAKSIYTNFAAATNPSQIYIRTPQQMIQMSAPTVTSGVNFIQERDLDFTNISLGNSAAVVMGIFDGIFDGSGNIIKGLTINYTQSGTSVQTSYVGLFSRNNGTISRVTLVFDGTSRSTSPIRGNVNAQVGSAVYVGSIAGQNTGMITDISIVSSILDINSENVIVPTGGSGAKAGGVVGENTGKITSVIYLAPAPNNGTEIYPIINSEAGTSAKYMEVYYLGGISTSEVMIIDSENNTISSVNGFDYIVFTQPVIDFTMVDTEELYITIEALPYWTNQIPSIWTLPSSTPMYDFVYENTYPYVNRIISSTQSVPTAWPIVIEGEPELIATTASEWNIELSEMHESEMDEIAVDESCMDDLGDNDNESNTSDDGGEYGDVPDELTGDDNGKGSPNESYTDNVRNSEEDGIADSDEDTTSRDGFAIATGVITLFGGAGFTQTRIFKRYMRKRNARAVRRINEYNRCKRNGRRVNRYILRYHEQRNREWRR
ncbi:MAG: prepilin-type N-terminal cleavage/methylation domain-containing protein [Oscillospiraceae bacterium]|nr:prepilin-type N-terminal cleavage/methylation domain-containing protein [Oscillospiraceae bacterium]